jgi:hypothetical protein
MNFSGERAGAGTPRHSRCRGFPTESSDLGDLALRAGRRKRKRAAGALDSRGPLRLSVSDAGELTYVLSRTQHKQRKQQKNVTHIASWNRKFSSGAKITEQEGDPERFCRFQSKITILVGCYKND